MGVLNEITGKCALAIRLEIFFMANGRDESFFISKTSSSCTCKSNLVFLNTSSLDIFLNFIIALFIISAAAPCIGALIAVLSAALLTWKLL